MNKMFRLQKFQKFTRPNLSESVLLGFCLMFGISATALAAGVDLNSGASGICSVVTAINGKFLGAAAGAALVGALITVLVAGAEISEGIKKVVSVLVILGLTMAGTAIVVLVTGAGC